MQKKKILILHNILWAHYKSVLFEEITAQKPENMDILVLQIAKNEIGRKNMETNFQENWKYKYHLLFDDYIENIPRLSKIRETLRFIQNYQPDLINITGYGVDIVMPIVIIWAKIRGIKIVISSESTALDATKSFFKEKFKSYLVQSAKGFIAFGSHAKNYLLALGADTDALFVDYAAVVDDKKIYQIYKNAKETQFNIPGLATHFNFIYVGRFAKEKNLLFLLENFNKLKKENPESKDWGMIWIGDGDQKEILQTYVLEHQVKNVCFVPSMPWYEVPQYFAIAHCLVLPSSTEPWGLVVNEAMICALPVIVSNKCGCAPDLVNGNGFVFDLKEKHSLFQAMLSIIKLSPEKRIEYQFKSIEIIKKFNVSAVATRILECFKVV